MQRPQDASERTPAEPSDPRSSPQPPGGAGFKAGAIHTGRGSRLRRYGALVVGSTRLWDILRYEIIMLLCRNRTGILGLFLRSKLYPRILGSVGKGVVFGAHVTFRHPAKIHLGDRVVLDDHCLIDAKGSGNDGIRIGNDVFIGRGSILSCKDGNIILEDKVLVGFYCSIFSNSRVRVGRSTMLAAYTYLVGGGSYTFDDLERPIAEQNPTRSLGGIDVGPDGWIGAGVVVTDGTRIGRGCVIGAGAVVNKQVPDFAIAAGVPARVIGNRRGSSHASSPAEPPLPPDSEPPPAYAVRTSPGAPARRAHAPAARPRQPRTPAGKGLPAS